MKPKQFPAYLLVIVAATLVTTAGCKRSTSPANNAQADSSPATSGPIRVSGDVDAAEPAIATARASNGSETIYVAWVEHRDQAADVMLRDFNSVGQPLHDAVRVNPNGVNATAWRGDPPTVALAPDGAVYVGWTSRVESNAGQATDIQLSASHDGGQTFAPPVKVNDDPKLGDHGMHSLAVGQDGRVYVAWLDERNVKQMDEASMPDMPSGHHTEANREVFFSSSSDGGRTFSVNKSVATDVCPCCKTNLAVASDGRVYLSWRQVLPGDFRHIAVAASGDAGATFSKPVVVSDDEWVLKGCPVTGAALLPEAKGKLRVLWYAAGSKGEHGIYWSESQDGGQTFAPRTLVAATGARGTPALANRSAASADDIWGVWETNDNGRIQVTTARVGVKPAVTTSVADKGELPAAASTAKQLFVVYLVREGGKGTIWLASAGRDRESF